MFTNLLINIVSLLILINRASFTQIEKKSITNNEVNAIIDKCIVEIKGVKQLKDIGSIWTREDDLCIQHSCVFNDSTLPYEEITKLECSKKCDDEYDLTSVPGKCCGDCVQTKCKHNDRIYNIGENWKSSDNCTILSCDLNHTGPVISAFKKYCSTFEANCPKQFTYVEDCCPMCSLKKGKGVINSFISSDEEEITTEEFYKNHPCNRECVVGEKPMICKYNFAIEWYETLSKACYDCPKNLTDCGRPHCIVGDGARRSLTVINRMMPGPSIEVCFGDTIVVDLTNHLLGESTTLHWHGIHQKESPYMDGVPHVTQCPVHPHAIFRYNFKANNAGTHFWHSHTGMQRGDGAFGALIIRQPKVLDRHSKLYDFDLYDHKMIIQDYAHITGIAMFSSHHHSIGSNKPPNILVNGKGRYYPEIFQDDKKEFSTTNTDLDQIEITPKDVLLLHPKAYNKFEDTIRKKRSSLINSENVLTYPLETFKVTKGYSYRFRLINAEFLNCPIAVSIDNHTLMAINSDGSDFEPVYVQSIVSYAGERFDFIVEANEPVGNYWIRFKGLMDCDERFTKAFQVAILQYEGASNEEPQTEKPSYEFEPGGIQLNPLNRGSGHVDSLALTELTPLNRNDDWILKADPDYKFYVYYDFYAKDNPDFHKKNLYGFNQITNTNDNRLFTPQLNHISMKVPDEPYLLTKDKFNDSSLCNETSLLDSGKDCRSEFCQCGHVLQVKLNSLVEIILIDEGWTFDANHPFHLHGYDFKVVGMERVRENVTVEMIKQMDEMGLLIRKRENAITKDTVTVPDGGYTIIRFRADNPGYWLFHCHIEFHAEIGMALVLKVGEGNDMLPAPIDFPTCHNYLPPINKTLETKPDDEKKNNAVQVISSIIVIKIFLVLNLILTF